MTTRSMLDKEGNLARPWSCEITHALLPREHPAGEKRRSAPNQFREWVLRDPDARPSAEPFKPRSSPGSTLRAPEPERGNLLTPLGGRARGRGSAVLRDS